MAGKFHQPLAVVAKKLVFGPVYAEILYNLII